MVRRLCFQVVTHQWFDPAMLGLIILNMVLICMAYRFASRPVSVCPWRPALGALPLVPCPWCPALSLSLFAPLPSSPALTCPALPCPERIAVPSLPCSPALSALPKACCWFAPTYNPALSVAVLPLPCLTSPALCALPCPALNQLLPLTCSPALSALLFTS